MTKREHPWQSGPADIINNHALHHLNRVSDVDQRSGFLLLDAGAETSLKTFLLLPDKVTSVKMGYGERRKAAEGNFHELVAGIRKAASERLRGINLSHFQYYHGIRNKLYHEGDGVTVDPKQAEAYTLLILQLLDRLLGIKIRRPFRGRHRVLLGEYSGGAFDCAICAKCVSTSIGPV